MNFEFLAFIQSVVFSVLIFFPIMMVVKSIIVKYGTPNMQMVNWSDNIVRSLALTIFLIMTGIAGLVIFHWENWYGILGPIEVILSFLFIPLYRKME